MKTFFYFLFALLLLTTISCDKDSHKRVKYTVTSKSTVQIGYTMNGKTFDITEEAGSWSVSYRAKVGSDYFLSALKTSPLFEMNVVISIDGEEFDRTSTKDIELVALSGLVP